MWCWMCQVYDLDLVNRGKGLNWIENTGLWEVFTCWTFGKSPICFQAPVEFCSATCVRPVSWLSPAVSRWADMTRGGIFRAPVSRRIRKSFGRWTHRQSLCWGRGSWWTTRQQGGMLQDELQEGRGLSGQSSLNRTLFLSLPLSHTPVSVPHPMCRSGALWDLQCMLSFTVGRMEGESSLIACILETTEEKPCPCNQEEAKQQAF